MRRGNLRWHEAEEIASLTFEVLLKKSLVQRWYQQPRAKLRTLLCAVACRIQSNYVRSASRRECSASSLEIDLNELVVQDGNWQEVFYSAWVDDLLQTCLNMLVREYHAQNRGDYVRVLYGRVNEGLSIAEVSAALGLTSSTVDNYFRHAKKRLKASLKSAIQRHVMRYSGRGMDGFEEEWLCLSMHLRQHGGLADAVRNAEKHLPSSELSQRRFAGVKQALRDSGLHDSCRLAPE